MKPMEKKMLILTEKGILGGRDMSTDDVLAMLLHAFLNVWDRDKFEIEYLDAAKHIVDSMVMFRKGEPEEEEDFLEMLGRILFDDDDEEDEDE